ncbi:hypothetical protein B0H14DRAFT_3692051 [Mycena olivaceomarginata]|nr:hypothetical protein B0H14DRAFT_3692051 [Mycena olivaceomarginata]
MFSKILTFGIGALALVQGALAIAPGRYYITNPMAGKITARSRGNSIFLMNEDRPRSGLWTVEQLGEEYTITNNSLRSSPL